MAFQVSLDSGSFWVTLRNRKVRFRGRIRVLHNNEETTHAHITDDASTGSKIMLHPLP